MAKRASKDTPKDKLAELKAKQFAAEGREERITRALQALETAKVSFTLDRKTWKWVAEDVTIEDI